MLQIICWMPNQTLLQNNGGLYYNLGHFKWKINTTPPPNSVMGKMARFGFRANPSLNRGEGRCYFSFYSVRDCSYEPIDLLCCILHWVYGLQLVSGGFDLLFQKGCFILRPIPLKILFLYNKTYHLGFTEYVKVPLWSNFWFWFF